MLLASLLIFTACGDGDASGTSTSGTPECSEVWVAGQTLPENYEGCTNGDEIEAAFSYDCEDGTSLFANDDFWVRTPGEIVAMDGEDDPAYSKAFDDCKGL